MPIQCTLKAEIEARDFYRAQGRFDEFRQAVLPSQYGVTLWDLAPAKGQDSAAELGRLREVNAELVVALQAILANCDGALNMLPVETLARAALIKAGG